MTLPFVEFAGTRLLSTLKNRFFENPTKVLQGKVVNCWM